MAPLRYAAKFAIWQPWDREGSSVHRLITERDLDLKEFMVGSDSLGAYMEDEGYSAIPSPSIPKPG